MASGEITYKTLKQAKIAYAIAGWSIDLEEENLVIVSKQKKCLTSYMQSYLY